MKSPFQKFLKAMQIHLPEEGRIMACQFRGDPNSDIYGKWRARVVHGDGMIDEMANVYLCVSAMKKNNRGEFRRRKENFAGGLLLMIDDVGGGKGAKFPLELLDPLPPTALIETSPGNFQATYFFDRLITDLELFDALIRAFIKRQFLGVDTGQAGVNRVFRPPIGVNGKSKYEQRGQLWKVCLSDWRPELRYSVEEIAKAFSLHLTPINRLPKDPNIIEGHKAGRIRAFISVRASIRAAGMIKREEADYSGWIQIECPWIDQHSDKADTGAAMRIPAPENEWYGGFRCHHCHCEGKGWSDLTNWLASEQTVVLELINDNAPEVWV